MCRRQGVGSSVQYEQQYNLHLEAHLLFFCLHERTIEPLT